MSILTMKERNSNKPAETAQLTESLEAAIWIADGKDGTRFHWNVGRINPKGGSFRTLRPENLLELPKFTAGLALAFAKAPQLPAELREQLLFLGNALQALNERGIVSVGAGNGQSGVLSNRAA